MEQFNMWPDLPLQIPLEWLIRVLVLTSMLLQVFLVVFGAFRYVSSSPYLRLFVWMAYISADAVAISAIGTMMHSFSSATYGIWTPLLLLHLGGPDTITAYSVADNELWLRHGFNMIYQVGAAAYVMYVSRLKGYPLVTALLLYIAGTVKYAERTAALSFASHSEIVSSTDPISTFMQHENKLADDDNVFNYLVMGEEHIKLGSNTDPVGSIRNLLRDENDIVTIEDVRKREGDQQTTENYILCVSHALYKMYKRRFVSLYFHEGFLQKTRRFFFNDSLKCDQVFGIIERELKFIYDALFTKSSRTAFSRLGLLSRLVNIFLLGGASILIFSGLEDKLFNGGQKTVTYVLISVAIVMEIIQLCRIMLSDWAMVNLVCSYIRHSSRSSTMQKYWLIVIQKAMLLIGTARSWVVGRRYWNNKMQQYHVSDACLTSWRWIWRMAGLCDNRVGNFIVPWYLKGRHMGAEPVDNDFRSIIFDSLKEKCSPEIDIDECRNKIYGFEEQLITDQEGENLRRWTSQLELEESILTWHLATSLCQEEDGYGGRNNSHDNGKENENEIQKKVRFSRILSGYCAYLLVSHPNLLPLHADIAKKAYMELHREIIHHLRSRGINSLKLKDLEDFSSKTSVLVYSAELAQQLMQREEEERWEIFKEFWAGQLIYISVYNKASIHAECLTAGGEFLSQVWVLLGHMGCGEQSDTAVSKKREEKSKKEEQERRREEEARRREEEEARRRGEEEARRQKVEETRRRIVETIEMIERRRDY